MGEGGRAFMYDVKDREGDFVAECVSESQEVKEIEAADSFLFSEATVF